MSNFFKRLLNDSSSSDEEKRNTWFAAAIEFERQTHKVGALEIESVGNTDIMTELAAIPDC